MISEISHRVFHRLLLKDAPTGNHTNQINYFPNAINLLAPKFILNPSTDKSRIRQLTASVKLSLLLSLSHIANTLYGICEKLIGNLVGCGSEYKPHWNDLYSQE